MDPTGPPTDIALVSLGTTMGLRESDAAFARLVRDAGASCEVLPVTFGAAGQLRRRSAALIDLVEALAARRAAGRARGRARAIVYSSVTAALLEPAPGVPTAIRFDGIAAQNRPGVGGAWQRRRERSVLGAVTLLLPLSEPAAEAAAAAAEPAVPPMVLFPPPLSVTAAAGPGGATSPTPNHAAAAYAANPDKRGLDLLCEAWRAAGRGATLAIGGIDAEAGRRWLARQGIEEPPGIDWLGRLDRDRWLDVVASAGVFVSAARFEDWGLAQMEALAAGTPLVTAATPGANVALPLARRLNSALVAAEPTAAALAAALRAGLALDASARASYAAAAAELLEPYGEEALRRRMAEEILPRLLPSSA
jgi:glycosyltransferase involved in cell wall biosynthesis